jgi:hypothetical protein
MTAWHPNVDEIPTKTSLSDEYTACNNPNIDNPIHLPHCINKKKHNSENLLSKAIKPSITFAVMGSLETVSNGSTSAAQSQLECVLTYCLAAPPYTLHHNL